jgi:hypothetical protein
MVVKPYLLDPQDLVELRESVKSNKLVPLPAEPQLLSKGKPQLPLKRGRGRPRKYLLLTAVIDIAITDAIIDIGTFTGNIADIANIAIYLQDDNTVDTAGTTIYL